MNIEEILITRESKMNFLKGLIRLAKCDDILDERELVFYQQAARGLGLDEKDIEELNSCWKEEKKINIIFETNKQKMFFFVQAVQLCWIDDKYKDIEKQEMRFIAKELNVSFSALEEIENWAYEGIVWNKKGEKLLELS